MRGWTKRDWLQAAGYAAAGFLLARLFPAFWDWVVRPLAIVVFIGLMVRHRRREDRRGEEQARREQERWQRWGEAGPGPTADNGGLN